MKVLPFKRKQEDQDLNAVDKSLNLCMVAHQKLEAIESLLDQGKVQNSLETAGDLRKLNATLDLMLKRLTVEEKYKKVV